MNWAPSTSWETLLRFNGDLTAQILLGILAILFAAAAVSRTLNRGDALILSGLVLLAIAGSGELFLLGWTLLGVRAFLGHSPPAARLTDLSFFVFLVLLHSLFKTTDFSQAVRVAQEPYEFDLTRASLAWIAVCIAAVAQTYAFPISRRRPAPRPVEDLWRFLVVPLAVTALLSRTAFVPSLAPKTAVIASWALYGLATAAAGIAGWYREVQTLRGWIAISVTLFFLASAIFYPPGFLPWIGAALAVVLYPLGIVDRLNSPRARLLVSTLPGIWLLPACALLRSGEAPLSLPLKGLVALCAATIGYAVFKAARHQPSDRQARAGVASTLPQWAKIPQNTVAFLEDQLWPNLWKFPGQVCRSLGQFFDFWQGGTPQYTLLVLLIGTLILFWAALKTQVIW